MKTINLQSMKLGEVQNRLDEALGLLAFVTDYICIAPELDEATAFGCTQTLFSVQDKIDSAYKKIDKLQNKHIKFN